MKVKLFEAGGKYLKHWTFVDNCNVVFPLIIFLKIYHLDLTMNFSRLTFLEGNLHCIVRFSILQSCVIIIIWVIIQSMMQFLLIIFFVISLRDMALKTKIFGLGVINNASNIYKSKHWFCLLQQAADEFGLRFICTYGAAGHLKGLLMEYWASEWRIFWGRTC